ncbi:hypothetical protein Nepgr_020399 [Nepenthes gracilis]|uniref:Uncharacterized protein n=1 Tax=Nepenthes gracilis TaxID=150966 RepID=A0AAD3SV04_NEPGR|nr:hypothetical protein Nepgr_020399 [Nepenthes gracilis]
MTLPEAVFRAFLCSAGDGKCYPWNGRFAAVFGLCCLEIEMALYATLSRFVDPVGDCWVRVSVKMHGFSLKILFGADLAKPLEPMESFVLDAVAWYRWKSDAS